MSRAGERGRGRKRLLAVAAAAVMAATTAAGLADAADPLGVPPQSRLFAATSGDSSELREKVPIERSKRAARRVVLTLGPAKLPPLEAGDRIAAGGEVTLSLTCVFPGESRCIGSHYGYSPKISGWIVLAGSEDAVGGRRAQRISKVDGMRCQQRRPNRNHHCVLVVKRAGLEVGDPGELPCRPDECRLNFVVAARHRDAGDGDVMVVGADAPDGEVKQDKARLNTVIKRGAHPRPPVHSSGELVSRRMPVEGSGKRAKKVFHSVRLDGLERGDVITAYATQVMSIAHLPYNVFLGSQLILADGRRERRRSRFVRRISESRGQLGERNGFNCTHGPSAYETPCLTRKVGQIRIRRDVVNGAGEPVPLYVNLVVGTLEKLSDAAPGDRVRALSGGGIKVRVHSPPESP